MATKYSEIVNKIREFLKEANELTKENEDRLKMLNEMYEILSVGLESDHETGEGATEATKSKDIVDKLFKTILPRYFTELPKVAKTSSLVRKVESKQKEDKSAQLPAAMKVKIGEIKHYLAKAKEQMDKIDKILPPLVKKVRDAKIKRFRISEEEISRLELDVEDVEGELEDFKKYLDDGNRTVELLESDVNSELWKYGITIAAATSGAAAMIMIGGVAVFSTSVVANSSLKWVAQQLSGLSGIAASVAGVGLGTLSLFLAFAGLIKTHRESLTEQLDELKSEMRKITTEYETRQKNIKKRITDRTKR